MFVEFGKANSIEVEKGRFSQEKGFQCFWNILVFDSLAFQLLQLIYFLCRNLLKVIGLIFPPTNTLPPTNQWIMRTELRYSTMCIILCTRYWPRNQVLLFHKMPMFTLTEGITGSHSVYNMYMQNVFCIEINGAVLFVAYKRLYALTNGCNAKVVTFRLT